MLFSASGGLGMYALIFMHEGNKGQALKCFVLFIVLLVASIIYSIIIDRIDE
jgi:hypothetical protein